MKYPYTTAFVYSITGYSWYDGLNENFYGSCYKYAAKFENLDNVRLGVL